jgi:hypothetical protein
VLETPNWFMKRSAKRRRVLGASVVRHRVSSGLGIWNLGFTG